MIPPQYLDGTCKACGQAERYMNGKYLMELRLHFGLSRKEVCHFLANGSQRTLMRIETGTRTCSVKLGETIMEVIKLARDWKKRTAKMEEAAAIPPVGV